MNGVLFADGFEGAFVGVSRRFGMYEPVATYDYDKCIQTLIDRDGMTPDEAIEHFEYNVIGSWVGERTPTFIHHMSMAQVGEYADDAP
jgi:hypothetical protein